MRQRVAIVGAGVSGLTCGTLLAERGYRTAIFAEEVGQDTTSAVAAAIWYPYDAEPVDAVIAWALATYTVLVELSCDPQTGVSMIEQRALSRAGEIQIPIWATKLGARRLQTHVATGLRPVPHPAPRGGGKAQAGIPAGFTSGFSLNVPLMDTTIYLDYLAKRFARAGGEIRGARFDSLEDLSSDFALIVNCSGVGAKVLAHDLAVEPHRGQVAIVPKIELPYAVVCDDAPLMYVIPRAHDCVFGGSNEVSDNRNVDPADTARIIAECSRTLSIAPPKPIAQRVGLRPFRKSGVRVEAETLHDDRVVIHNYGHGGSGFTLSWGCAQTVFELAGRRA
jgi:D-amino-acid oxidase